MRGGVFKSQLRPLDMENEADSYMPFRYMFAFIVTPIDVRGKSFPVHIHFTHESHFMDQEDLILTTIMDTFEKKGIPVISLSYDADTK